jgi:hypothetical protein
MAAHVYWRIYITNQPSYGPLVGELRFYDSTGTQISTAGGTASASSVDAGGYCPGGTCAASNAFDGTNTTWWRGVGTKPAWLQMTFASAVAVDHMQLDAPGTGTNEYIATPQNIQLQYSDDNVTWVTVDTWNGVPWTALGQTRTLSPATAAPITLGISWRLYITATGVGAAGTELGGLNLFDLAGNPIPTTNYSAVASGTNYAGYGTAPMLAFDGNCTDWWEAGGSGPDWIRYDFPTAQQVGSFCLVSASGYTHMPTAFQLQYSYDDVTWVTVGSYTATWTGTCETNCFRLGYIAMGNSLVSSTLRYIV